jgi:hypothetical protein
MADLATMVASAYASVRGMLGPVAWRHNGNTYQGTRGQPKVNAQALSQRGSVATGGGFIRQLYSELKSPAPKAGDRISVRIAGEYKTCVIDDVMPGIEGADGKPVTILIQFSPEGT